MFKKIDFEPISTIASIQIVARLNDNDSMSWVTDNWIPLTVVGGLVGVSWYAGKHFDKAESYNASTKKTKPRKTNRFQIPQIVLNPDLPITSHNHPDNPMVGHIEQKCSSDVCDETVLTHDRRIGKRCLKCYYQNWEDLYDVGATDTPPPVDMSIPYDVRYKRNTPAEIAEQEKRSIARQKQINANRSKRYEERYQEGLKTPLWSKNPKNILGISWEDFENDREWDKQYAQILKDKKKMSEKGWRKKYGLKSESYASWNEHTCEYCGSTDIDYGNNWKCHDCGRYAAETFSAEKSYQEKIPPFTDKDIWNQGFYSQKVYPLGNAYEPQKLLTPIENGIPLRESGSFYNFPKVNYDSVKSIQITWRELLKIGKKERMIHLEGSRYQWPTMKRVFKKLPKNTVMQIKAFKNVPCVITFNYEGQEWYYTQAPYLEYWEHDEIREMYKAETFEADDAETFAAYVSKADTQRVRQLLKQEFPNLKFSVVKDGGRMSVSIMAGDIDFSDINDDVPRTKRYWERWGNPKPVFDGKLDINQYHLDGYNPKYTPLFEKIVSIMKGEDWFDDSDSQTDYFHTAYYIDLNIGKWNKPYEYKPTIKRGTRPTLESLVYKQGYGDDALTGLKGAYDEETFEAPMKGAQPRRGRYEVALPLDKTHTSAIRKALKDNYKGFNFSVKMNGNTTVVINLKSGKQEIDDWDSMENGIIDLAIDTIWEMEKGDEHYVYFDTKDEMGIDVYCFLGAFGNKEYIVKNAETFEAPVCIYCPSRSDGGITEIDDCSCGFCFFCGEHDSNGLYNHHRPSPAIRNEYGGVEKIGVCHKCLKNMRFPLESYEHGLITDWHKIRPTKITAYEYNRGRPRKNVWDFNKSEWVNKYRSETFEASAVARKKAKTPVEKVLLHEELMNQAARNEMITKLTYDLAMRRGVHRQPMRTLKEAEYDSKLKKEFGDD